MDKSQKDVWFHLYKIPRKVRFTEIEVGLWLLWVGEGENGLFNGSEFIFARWKEFWRLVAQQRECTERHWTMHLKMVKMANFMLFFLQLKILKIIWTNNIKLKKKKSGKPAVLVLTVYHRMIKQTTPNTVLQDSVVLAWERVGRPVKRAYHELVRTEQVLENWCTLQRIKLATHLIPDKTMNSRLIKDLNMKEELYS